MNKSKNYESSVYISLIQDFIDNKSELRELLSLEKIFSNQSRKKYNLAFKLYIKGDWK